MRSSRALLTRLLVVFLAAAHAAGLPVTASAQGQRSVPIVRDAEIEALVSDYARPIFQVAGLGQSGIEIVLVNDSRFNAFVAGRRIFIHTGTLMTAESPNEVIGVIAHETGHIAGGHQERLRQQLERSQTMAIVAALLGIGAGVAGAAGGSDGLAQAGAGIAIGGGEFARRGLLSYQRTEETTADRAAVTYLEGTGQSAKGMLATFDRFADSLALSGVNVDPYQISHPMPRERIANLETLARESPHFDRVDPPELQLRHDLTRAKIAAYTEGPAAVARLFRDDPGGLPARYGDAIATHLHGNPRAALDKVNRLISEQPGNAFFHEVRGDALMKARQPEAAADAYAKAVQLDSSDTGLLRVGHGRALLAMGQPGRAASEIEAGLSRASEFAAGYRYLAQAYGQSNNIAAADLATAEGHFYSGNYRDAKVFATRAQMKMGHGSPGWLRAQDIIDYQRPGED